MRHLKELKAWGTYGKMRKARPVLRKYSGDISIHAHSRRIEGNTGEVEDCIKQQQLAARLRRWALRDESLR